MEKKAYLDLVDKRLSQSGIMPAAKKDCVANAERTYLRHDVTSLGDWMSSFGIGGSLVAATGPARFLASVHPDAGRNLEDTLSTELQKSRDYYFCCPIYTPKEADIKLLKHELAGCWQSFNRKEKDIYGKNGGYTAIMPVFLIERPSQKEIKFIQKYASPLSTKFFLPRLLTTRFFCFPVIVDLATGEAYYRERRRIWGWLLYPRLMAIADYFFGKREKHAKNLPHMVTDSKSRPPNSPK